MALSDGGKKLMIGAYVKSHRHKTGIGQRNVITIACSAL